MKRHKIAVVLILLAGALAGCSVQEVRSVFTAGQAGEATATPQTYTSAVLVTTYPNALPASTQLALGILKLEGTPNAVTPEQARALLPLWQAIQNGAARTDAEVSAVLKQIEKAMKADQLQAIAAMQLTVQDVTDYARVSGLVMGPPSGAMGTDQAGGSPQGGQGSGAPGNMTDAQRQAFRATAEAGGFSGGQGGPGLGNLTEEQRASLRATAEAGGMPVGGFRQGGGSSEPFTFLVKPLVDLLTQRAAH